MTLDEIFDIESHNQSEIHLFRQGMFYRAFERSCVALRSIERYAVLKKRSAATGLEYIYSGFPASALDRITAGRGQTQVSEDYVIVSGRPVSDAELDRLKQNTPLAEPAGKPKPTTVAAPKTEIKTETKAEPKTTTEPVVELNFTQPTASDGAPQERQHLPTPLTLLELIRRFDLKGASPVMCKLFLTMIKTQL